VLFGGLDLIKQEFSHPFSDVIAEKQIAQGAEQVKDSALTLNILAGELYKLLGGFKIY
jgi:hypothetical protein